MFVKYLLSIWREFPLGLQLFITGIIRPRFRVAVAAMIFDKNGCILLCEHTYRKFHPWGLPGGGLDREEDPEDGIRREVREETGLEVEVQQLLLAERAPNIRHISLIYLCKIIGGVFQPNQEISQTQFFHLDKLPSLLPSERALIERVAGMLSPNAIASTGNDKLA
ncbi:MAG TPA: NUDIX hydrolase [Anaerolineales bacterium]|nr:NUDIX hydrolase [Anaerolineales bacterium]